MGAATPAVSVPPAADVRGVPAPAHLGQAAPRATGSAIVSVVSRVSPSPTSAIDDVRPERQQRQPSAVACAGMRAPDRVLVTGMPTGDMVDRDHLHPVEHREMNRLPA
jgi:hypothetical protein